MKEALMKGLEFKVKLKNSFGILFANLAVMINNICMNILHLYRTIIYVTFIAIYMV